MVKSKRIEHCRTDLLYWIHYIIDVTGFLAWCLAGKFGIYFSGVLRSIVCGIDHLIIMTGRPFRASLSSRSNSWDMEEKYNWTATHLKKARARRS